MTYNEYSGKPHGSITLAIGRKEKVDFHIDPPPADGAEDRLVYLNVDVKWKITSRSNPAYYHQVANLRVDWQRLHDPDGDTAYQDFTISPIKDQFLITHLHWEHGRQGIGGYWEMELDSPHATGATVGTRYGKGRLVQLQ